MALHLVVCSAGELTGSPEVRSTFFLCLLDGLSDLPPTSSHVDVHTVKSLRPGGVNSGQKLPEEMGNENVFPFLTVKLLFASAPSFFVVGSLQQLKTGRVLVEEHCLFSYATAHNLIK